MRTIIIEILMLIILVLFEWFNTINWFIAFLVFAIVLFIILITSIVYLKRKHYRLLVYLFLSTIIVLAVSYSIGIEVPPHFRKWPEKDSSSMQESQKDKAFISKYTILNTINSNKYGIKGKEIFVEKLHWYKTEFRRDYNFNDTIYKLLFIIENENEIKERGYASDWYFKSDRHRGQQLEVVQMIDLKDTIYVEILDKKTETPIDSLILVKVVD